MKQPADSIFRRLKALIQHPLFLFLAAFGNGAILVGSVCFHLVEAGKNPAIHSFLDSLMWAIGLVTTIGVVNVAPVTTAGKWISIFMMLGGAIFLWTYMGFIVAVLVTPEVDLVQKEIHQVETEVEKVRHEVETDEMTLAEIRHLVEKLQERLKRVKRSS